jgi:hypothetical protein
MDIWIGPVMMVRGGNHMKVGDLVELSAYGKKLKMLSHLEPGDVAIIVKKQSWGRYVLRWQKSSTSSKYFYYNRADLKYAKRRK